MPETYLVTRGTPRQDVIDRMAAAQTALLDELWPARAENLPFDTREEAIILASVVEKETGIASERPEVASVFVNRMRRGMRLESDPTIIYGISQGEPLGRGLRRSEIDNTGNAWNTYQIAGLPPTPIANPGANPWPPCSIRPRPARSSSSPTVRAAMSSPTPMPSTCAMSRNGAGSSASAARTGGGDGRALRHDGICPLRRRDGRLVLDLGGAQRQRQGAGGPFPFSARP